MNYIPGRVYRHKRRVAKRHRKAARNREILEAVVSVATIAASTIMFVRWWIM